MTRERIATAGLRTSTGDWTGPHVHRPGPLDRASAARVLDLLPKLAHWESAPPTRGTQRAVVLRGRGARRVLDWLSQQPGETWQERWFAGDGDDRAWIDRLAEGDPLVSRAQVRDELTGGIGDLFMLRVVAPGYGFFRDYRSPLLYSRAGRALAPEMFRLAEKAAGDLGMVDRQYADSQIILAKMSLHAGKTPDELDVEDFLEIRTFCMNTMGRAWRGLHGAWQICVELGFLPIQSTLRGATRTHQRSVVELVDDHRIASRPMRDLLVRYCEELRPALDHSSLRNIVSCLAGLFWADLEAHHPGIDSLHLPPDVATAWKERLNHTVDRGHGTRPRQNRGRFSVLTRVRAFYLDIQQWALEDPSWAPWAVPCPIRKSEGQGATKARQQATAVMHQRVRDRLPHLQPLVDSAFRHRCEQGELLNLAGETPIGGTFRLGERAFVRVTSQGADSPYRSQRGSLYVAVEEIATGDRTNLTISEDRAFWAWAVIETLRHTGVRVEELLEITHLALVSHRLRDTGEVVPLLQILPSKGNQERLLLVSPELASVLATIIGRVRDTDGLVPTVPRYDHHERLTGPPLPHLFQRNLGWRHEVISPTAVRKLLIAALARTGLRDTAGNRLHYTPHDFRRMFATEAVTGGLPVHIAAKILGHENISTTQHYLAVFQEDLVRSYRSFLQDRRSQRPSAEYREPTEQEWQEFQDHFQLRKVELGTCGRPYGSPCNHEHACIRCPMLRVDPRQRERLIEITVNLQDRIEEARIKGWSGEIQGLQVSLEAARTKLTALDRSPRTDLGMPSTRPASE